MTINSALGAAILCLAALFIIACVNPGQVGLVAHADLAGEGMLRTDGNVTVALGEFHGEYGVFGKSTDLPWFYPVSVTRGQVFLANRQLGLELTQDRAIPLPAWAATVFRSGEAEKLGLSFEP